MDNYFSYLYEGNELSDELHARIAEVIKTTIDLFEQVYSASPTGDDIREMVVDRISDGEEMSRKSARNALYKVLTDLVNNGDLVIQLQLDDGPATYTFPENAVTFGF